MTTLIPVIDRLHTRFGVQRVCGVADRGMISADTIEALEERKLEYLLGVRERSSREARTVVLRIPDRSSRWSSPARTVRRPTWKPRRSRSAAGAT